MEETGERNSTITIIIIWIYCHRNLSWFNSILDCWAIFSHGSSSRCGTWPSRLVCRYDGSNTHDNEHHVLLTLLYSTLLLCSLSPQTVDGFDFVDSSFFSLRPLQIAILFYWPNEIEIQDWDNKQDFIPLNNKGNKHTNIHNGRWQLCELLYVLFVSFDCSLIEFHSLACRQLSLCLPLFGLFASLATDSFIHSFQFIPIANTTPLQSAHQVDNDEGDRQCRQRIWSGGKSKKNPIKRIRLTNWLHLTQSNIKPIESINTDLTHMCRHTEILSST